MGMRTYMVRLLKRNVTAGSPYFGFRDGHPDGFRSKEKNARIFYKFVL